jgi:hypothetical protein
VGRDLDPPCHQLSRSHRLRAWPAMNTTPWSCCHSAGLSPELRVKRPVLKGR